MALLTKLDELLKAFEAQSEEKEEKKSAEIKNSFVSFNSSKILDVSMQWSKDDVKKLKIQLFERIKSKQNISMEFCGELLNIPCFWMGEFLLQEETDEIVRKAIDFLLQENVICCLVNMFKVEIKDDWNNFKQLLLESLPYPSIDGIGGGKMGLTTHCLSQKTQKQTLVTFVDHSLVSYIKKHYDANMEEILQNRTIDYVKKGLAAITLFHEWFHVLTFESSGELSTPLAYGSESGVYAECILTQKGYFNRIHHPEQRSKLIPIFLWISHPNDIKEVNFKEPDSRKQYEQKKIVSDNFFAELQANYDGTLDWWQSKMNMESNQYFTNPAPAIALLIKDKLDRDSDWLKCGYPDIGKYHKALEKSKENNE